MRNELRTNGLTMGVRDPGHNPRSPYCMLHLRRVCGVCVQFDGELRGDGVCRKMALALPGGRDAAECGFWERRSAGARDEEG